MGYFHKKNVFLDALIFALILFGILLVLVVTGSLFAIKSNDLTCTRSKTEVVCSWVRSTQFAKNIEVKIINPTSVRVIETLLPQYGGSPHPYFRAEIISGNPPSKLPLYSDDSDQVVRSLVQELSEFLLSTDKSLFHKKF